MVSEMTSRILGLAAWSGGRHYELAIMKAAANLKMLIENQLKAITMHSLQGCFMGVSNVHWRSWSLERSVNAV